MADHPTRNLPADHPAHRCAVLALWFCLAVAIAFTAFACVTTQVHAVRAGSPWQDDPYDGVVSFTMFLVPALAALATTRTALYRRGTPQPVHRVDQLLRAAALSTALVAATMVTDWSAVTLRADRQLWTSQTPWLVTALVPLTASAAAGLVLQRRAARQLPSAQRRQADGDWLDDLALLADASTARLPGPLRRQASRLDSRAATGFARRHLFALAAAASLSAGLLLAIGQTLGEGWPGPLLFLTETAVNAGGLLAFSVLCNATLRIAVPRDAGNRRPRTRDWSRAARSAATAAAVAMPVSGALRDTVWTLVGHVQRTSSPAELASLVFASAALTGVVTCALSLAHRRKD